MIAVISHACVLQVNRAVYRELQEMGYAVALIVPEHVLANDRVVECEPRIGPDPVLTKLKLRGRNPRNYRLAGLIRMLDRIQPEAVILDNDPLSVLSVEVGLWCRLRNRRLLCISSENLGVGLRNTVQRLGVRRGCVVGAAKYALLHGARPLVSHVFAISRDGAALFSSLRFKSVSITPLGFDPELFAPNVQRRVEIRQTFGWDGVIVAYFGRIVPEKGVHLLIDALSRVKDLEWRFMLDLFSGQTSSYGQHVNARIDEVGIRDRVLYVDTDHRHIGGYMGAADIVVVPSISTGVWKEQYGRVAAEAMACGTLVVAARSGSLTELIGDGGVIFEEGDVAELTQLLRRSISEPELYADRRMRGCKRAHNMLTARQQALVMRDALL